MRLWHARILQNGRSRTGILCYRYSYSALVEELTPVHKKVVTVKELTPEEQNFGRGKSLIQSCKIKCNLGRKTQVQPECVHVDYDISFFTACAAV